MKISNLSQKIKTFTLDTLFPISCISCGKDNVWFCDECLQKIGLLSFQVCPKCEKNITEDGIVCRNCKPISPLDRLLAACRYKSDHAGQNTLAKLVHLYKYRFIEDLRVPLGKILTKAILQSQLPIPDIILPVPLHPRRLRWRGFNQSRLLAVYISKHLAINYEIPVPKEWLVRKRSTQPQMKIKKYSERLNNLRDAFAVNPKIHQHDLQGKTILLVDDIATTGATLFECARILKQKGARKVFAIVIARQEI